MIELLIKRRIEYKNVAWSYKGKVYKPEDSTISDAILIKDGKEIYKCFCLENGGPSTDTPKQDKRIIARTYNLYETLSSVSLPSKYCNKDGTKRCISLYTNELPSFKNRRIHIHIGNSPQNSEGCLLFGEIDNRNGTIGASTKAVTIIYDYLFAEKLENCKVIIEEIK